MRDFKVPMPRKAPDPGMVHVVIAVKKADGYRSEYIGQLPEAEALKLFTQVVECTLLPAEGERKP